MSKESYLLEKISKENINGTATYTDTGGTQDIVELTGISNIKKITDVYLDMSNITQDGTFSLQCKEAGLSTYTEFATVGFDESADDDLFVISIDKSFSDDFRLRYTESADETANRDIGYDIHWEGE